MRLASIFASWLTLTICACNSFLPVNLNAQPSPDTLWTRTYGGTGSDFAYSVKQTTDGGYIVAGGTLSFGAGDWDCYLVKTDASGDTVWTRSYGGYSADEARSVQQTVDGGYIITGYSASFGGGSYDVYLVRTDAEGDTLWTRTYGGQGTDWGLSVEQTTDGGFIVAGVAEVSFGAVDGDFCLIKTDAMGDTLWTRTFGGANWDQAQCVQQTADGGYIVAGYTASFGAGTSDFYLVKTDGSGNQLWMRTYGGNNSEGAFSVQQTADGGYILAGSTNSFGWEDLDFYLVKTDGSGNQLWMRTCGTMNDDQAESVDQTVDGGYILAGLTNASSESDGDFGLVKYNGSGDWLWSRTYGGENWEEASSVQQTADGGYIVAGYTQSFGVGYPDFYLVKTGPDYVFMLQAPSNLTIQKVGPNMVLGWSPVEGATIYNIYRSSADPHGGFIRVAQTPDTLYTDLMGADAKAFYRVTAQQ